MKYIIIASLLLVSTFAWQSFAPGEGPFAHLSDEEFVSQYLMKVEEEGLQTPPSYDHDEFLTVFGTEGFDWREHETLSHCVGDIRNQGSCGSCWAHAINEFLSDRYCIASGGELKETFAPQFMVDCADDKYEAEGCDGAETQVALHWAEDVGLVSETCYPYFSGETREQGQCYDSECPTGEYAVRHKAEQGSVQLYFNYTNVEIAQDILENGPLYFSMVVFGDFKAYKGGVYHPIDYEVKGTHAVKCLGWGYDEESCSHYWICANSWSEDWGEDGFFRIGFNNFIGYKAGSAKMDMSTSIKNMFSS